MTLPDIDAWIAVHLADLSAGLSLVALLLSYLSYRHARFAKIIDLRLQIGQILNSLQVSIEGLPGLMSLALQSRQRVCAMTGQSGALQHFEQEYVNYKAATAELADEFGNLDKKPIAKQSAGDLAELAVRLHGLGLRATRLTEKYRAASAKDDVEHLQRRDDIRMQVLGSQLQPSSRR